MGGEKYEVEKEVLVIKSVTYHVLNTADVVFADVVTADRSVRMNAGVYSAVLSKHHGTDA